MTTGAWGRLRPHLADLEHDDAVRGIVLMNAAVLVGAWISGEGLTMLLWPYWIQSMVIGYFAVRRLQKLQRFSTEGLKVNGRSVDPTPETRRSVWRFFIVHYGLFHLVYFMFLGSFATMNAGLGLAGEPLGTGDLLWIAATFVGFMASHGASHREHVEADLRGTPNVGHLMFVPYIRIIPMHLTIILGALLGDGLGMLLFAALKTVADVAMHKVEHRMLQR